MIETIEGNNNENAIPIYREPRIRKLVKIELFADNEGAHAAIVRNLSRFGLRATMPIDLRPYQSIEIGKTGYGKLRGIVRWVHGGEFGMQFDEPIDVEQFDFGLQNARGHFVKKIENGHVWHGFQTDISKRRPGFGRK